MGFLAILGRRPSGRAPVTRGEMHALPDPEDRLIAVHEDLHRAQGMTRDLMAKVVAAGTRITTPGGAAKAARIERLIELEAWTEAALAVVELELPQWKVRRLVCEEGAWICSLSRQWKLPAWLVDDVETRHESLPLAILTAVIEARRCAFPASNPSVSSVPRCGVEADHPCETICCDNFA
jgi:hypothetical protein